MLAAVFTAAVLVAALVVSLPSSRDERDAHVPTAPAPGGQLAPDHRPGTVRRPQMVAPSPWTARPRDSVVAVESGAVRGPSTSVVIPYSGTLDGAPESVYLSGLARLTSIVVRDPDFGRPPGVRLSVDLSDVSGVGVRTGMRYVAGGEEGLIRPLVASDLVEVTFPVVPDHLEGAALARQAVASFALAFDVTTGRLIAATAGTNVNLLDLPGGE
jgi:hypothetical protein